MLTDQLENKSRQRRNTMYMWNTMKQNQW